MMDIGQEQQFFIQYNRFLDLKLIYWFNSMGADREVLVATPDIIKK
jgi:hypothetical protein